MSVLTLDEIDCTDLFSGAGGQSIGARKAGVRPRLALNHWPLAIETHNVNHPEADHDCVDISTIDPRRYRSTTILLASPDCTYHSSARGKRARTGPQSIEAERSRATMWDVCHFAEHHRYKLILVENVVEVVKWPPFEAWLLAMQMLGYEHQELYVNSMVTGAPQSRDRFWCLFWRRGMRTPDVEIRPPSWCTVCERTVEGVQSWKNKAKTRGKHNVQYVYRCSGCNAVVKPNTRPALDAIDLNLRGQVIGERKQPYAVKTIERVQKGIDRFWVNDRAPFIAELHGTSTARSVRDPLMALAAGGTHHALIEPEPFWVRFYGGEVGKPVSEPLGAITAIDHHGVVRAPFLTPYYGTSTPTTITEPVGTLTTVDRFGLVGAPPVREVPKVEDCTLRMLQPFELGRAMAFPDDYVVLGTKRQKTRLYGQAVTPTVPELVLGRALEVLS